MITHTNPVRQTGGLPPSPFMRLWVVDTDAGLVAITAESDDEAQLSSAVAIAEGIAASIAASPITG